MKRKASGRARVKKGKGGGKGKKHANAREDRGGRVVTKKRYRGQKVHWTKNGQPYIIKSDGKARFIKK